MEKINLFIMDMSYANNTSGVERYMLTLIKGLESYPHINVHWIHLRYDTSLLFNREEHNTFYTKVTIALPQHIKEIINESFWIKKYNEQIYRLTEHLFKNKSNCILHLHTLNLIELAVLIKDRISCKIITHLHCIPWKGYYNSNKRKFNELFKQYYIEDSLTINSNKFITGNIELRSYIYADHIVCVTGCASDFLKKINDIPEGKISVIPNGIDDYSDSKFTPESDKYAVFKLLYVGVLSESKGLEYILKAMRRVKQRGYNVTLTIAGKTTSGVSKRLKEENSDLSLNILGRIPFDELKLQYIESDSGIIASLQEQSSYVAIEMAMFGLPVVTTAIDGLDEIFTDNINALKVNTNYSNITGLSVNVEMMADKIIALIENKKLRDELSNNIRELYEKELTIQRMMQQTISVYQKLIGEYAK